MPSISASYQDLCRLVGREIPVGRLQELLQMMGMEAGGSGEEMKLEVAHNRPDLLTVEGIARALKGFLGVELGLPEYKLGRSGLEVVVDPTVKGVRPHIACGVVREVDLDDPTIASIMQTQEKLHLSYCRNRKKASIGVYDLDTIRGPIHYTAVSPDEIKFTPLEFSQELTPAQILQEHPKGRDYAHLLKDFDKYPILMDSQGTVLSMPPIVNSEDTKVTEKTRSLFIDVTGISEEVVESALTILMTALAERGFRLESVRVKEGKRIRTTPNFKVHAKRLRVSTTNQTLGLELKPGEMARIARKMRYGVRRISKDSITLLVPPYRTDILHEVDLIEDIAIGYGYDKLEPTIPGVSTVGAQSPIEKISSRIRLLMVGLGFTEVMLYSLTSKRKAGLFGKEFVEIANPISEEYAAVRNSLLPSLLDAALHNQHYPTPQKLFEIGNVVVLDPEYETGARTVRRVAGIIVGRGSTYTNIRGIAETLLRELEIEHELSALDERGFIEGRGVKFLKDGKEIGKAGEVHPALLEEFGLENPIAAFEIEIGSI